MSLNNDLLTNDTNLPRMCTRHYDGRDGYFSGSVLTDLETTLSRITERFNSEPHNLNPCVELMLNYLCHYYFPLCNQTTGEITPVCSRSCTLLTNNQNCSALREIANEELEQENVLSPGDSCAQTYQSFVNQPPVSENCLAIEG